MVGIALDYDDTFTVDKELWIPLIDQCKRKGYDIRFVTARFETTHSYSNEEIVKDSELLNIPIIFCNGIQKKQRCIDVGFDVDIWIDDFPVLIPLQNELECILRGVRVNDNKQRTVLNKYSTDPLVITS